MEVLLDAPCHSLSTHWMVCMSQVAPSSDATTSLTLPTSEPWKVQAQFIKDSLTKLGVPKDGLDAVVCTAGGWQGVCACGAC